MKEFTVFMFQGIYSIVACLLDDGFANKMSMDTIIAYGSYIPTTWVLRQFFCIGTYAYTNTYKKPKTCFVIGFVVSVLTTLLILPIYKYIHFFI